MLTPSDLEALPAYIDELDPRKASERYNRIADAFYAQTRLWPPGRSMPMAMGGQSEADRDRAWVEWRRFCDEWHERRNDEARSLLPKLLRLARLGMAASGLLSAIERCGCNDDVPHAHYCHEARDRLRAATLPEKPSLPPSPDTGGEK